MSATPKIAVIIPTYNALDYTRQAIDTLFEFTPESWAIVVDDASPEWTDNWLAGVKNPVKVRRFSKNGGLTRSWNEGFRIAFERDFDYIVAGNNDVLFSKNWWRGMVDVLENSTHSLVGPLSNAAGVTAGDAQDICTYLDNYVLTDEQSYLNELSEVLYNHYGDQSIKTPVNGFFMMAKRQTWLNGMYDKDNVFQPYVARMPSGRKNPYPLMAGQEDELQARWRKKGMTSAISLGSFMFHYRSVSRGRRFAQGHWMRKKSN